jgi:hypothetical protein
MREVFVWIAVAVLAGLLAFQLLLVAGRPLGDYAWGGAHRVLPPPLRIASVIAILVYVAAAIAILEAARITDVVEGGVSRLFRALAAAFGAGVILNAVSRDRKERVMAPVALLLANLLHDRGA